MVVEIVPDEGKDAKFHVKWGTRFYDYSATQTIKAEY